MTPSTTDLTSELATLAASIRDTPLCAACIAAKCAMSLAQLDVSLLRLRATVAHVMTLGPCEGCKRDTLRYQIT